MDIHRNFQETPGFPKLPQADGLYFLGQLWFYTFLVNHKQNISDIYSALSKAADRNFPEGTASFAEASPVFSPENIFWNPEGKAVRKTYRPLWEKVLRLGYSLMQFSWKQSAPGSPDVFLQELEALREEVKETLFQEGLGKEEKEILPSHPAILKILEKVLKKWQLEEIEPPWEESMETIILTPEDYPKRASSPSIPDLPIKEETPETVMISPAKLVHEPSSMHPQERIEEDTPETVIISPSRMKGKAEAPPGAGKISAAILREDSSTQGGKVPAPEAAPEEPPEEDLSATVILSPKELREKKGKYGTRR